MMGEYVANGKWILGYGTLKQLLFLKSDKFILRVDFYINDFLLTHQVSLKLIQIDIESSIES